MIDDWYSMQIRVGQRLRDQIRRLSEQHDSTNADIVRGSLELGLQIMEKLLEAREIMAKEYLRLLKNQSRKKTRRKNTKIESSSQNTDAAAEDINRLLTKT